MFHCGDNLSADLIIEQDKYFSYYKNIVSFINTHQEGNRKVLYSMRILFKMGNEGKISI